ncbi:hypothetical protein BD560DRAFT_309277, partial [Blakeslea trispora]
LAQNNGEVILAGKKLPTFRGTEDEDFKAFLNTLEDHFGVHNITSENQKTSTLKILLVGKAKADFNANFTRDEETGQYEETYTEITKVLRGIFGSKKENSEYQIERFFRLSQLKHESPKNYYLRIMEAAEEANITDQNIIKSKFITGLYEEIQDHCHALGASSFDDYMKYAQGYYTA